MSVAPARLGCVRPAFAVEVLLLLLAAAGCGRTPWAAEQSVHVADEEPPMVTRLSGAEQAAVRSTFDELAAGYASVDPPRTAPHGRWSDVPAAVHQACAACEVAVFGRESVGDRLMYEIRTITGQPGRLVLSRADDERVYVVEEATFGLYGDGEDLRARLLRELGEALRELGRRPRFEDD